MKGKRLRNGICTLQDEVERVTWRGRDGNGAADHPLPKQSSKRCSVWLIASKERREGQDTLSRKFLDN